MKNVIDIPLVQIQRHKTNRKVAITDPATKELADSIKGVGVLQPVGVVPIGKDKYELVFGERRMVASKVAGEETIPAVVFPEGTDIADIEAMAAVENLQRVDLDPMDELAQLTRLEKTMNIDEIVATTGKSKNWFFRRKGLAKLTKDWQKLAQEHPEIPVLRLEEIARLPEEAQTQAFDHWQDWDVGHLVVCPIEEFRNTLADFVDWRLPSLWALDDSTLYPQAGSCDECIKRSGANPDLFDEASFPVKTHGETCLDPTCYRIKQQLMAGKLYAEACKKAKQPLFIVFPDADTKDRILSINDAFKDAQGCIDSRVIHSTANTEDAFKAYDFRTGKVMWFTSWDSAVMKNPLVQSTIKNPKNKAKAQAAKAVVTGEAGKAENLTATGAVKKTVNEKIRQKLLGFWKAVVEEIHPVVDMQFDPEKHLSGWDLSAGPGMWIACFGMLGRNDVVQNPMPWKNIWRTGTSSSDGLMQVELSGDGAHKLRLMPCPDMNGKQRDYGPVVYVGKPRDVLGHHIRQILLDRLAVPSSLSATDIEGYLPDLFLICDFMGLKVEELFGKQAEGFKIPASWKTEAGSEAKVIQIWEAENEKIKSAAMAIVIDAKHPPVSEKRKAKTGATKKRVKKGKAEAVA